MMILLYESKKELKQSIGKKLKYTETSIFGPEYLSNGTIYGSNRPHLTGYRREFYASVKVQNDKIVSIK